MPGVHRNEVKEKRPHLRRKDGRVCKISLCQQPIRDPNVRCPPEMRDWMYTTHCNERMGVKLGTRHRTAAPISCLACIAAPKVEDDPRLKTMAARTEAGS